MGFGRVVGSGCLGALCLIPMSWISFTVFDLGAAATGGALENIGTGLNTYLPVLLPGPMGQLLPVILGGLLGLFIVLLFPMHWFLYYRPDQWVYALAVMTPWVLTCFITALITSHSPRGGANTSFAIGIFYILTFGTIMLVLSMNDAVGTIVTGAITGLTDLHPFAAVLLSVLEGCGIGAVFGALAGAIRYKPTHEDVKEKEVKGKSVLKSSNTFEPFSGSSYEGKTSNNQPSAGATSNEKICPNCAQKVKADDMFCMNCGYSF